eukprot:g22944.t1
MQDLEKIFFHVRQTEATLEPGLSQLQEQAMRCGLLMEDSVLKHLQDVLPITLESPAEICQRLIDMRMMQDPVAMAIGTAAAVVDPRVPGTWRGRCERFLASETWGSHA